MKKIIFPLMLMIFILTIHLPSFATTATVNVTAVRIRESASTDANIVTNLYKEDKVEILEENGQWYKVQYGDKIGYAKSEFFTKNKENTPNTTPQNTVTPEPPKTSLETPTVSQENTNSEIKVGETITLSNAIKVRRIPSLLAEENNEITPQKVNLETEIGNWYKITAQTTTGWITKSKLNKALKMPEPPVQTPEPPVVQQPEAPEPPIQNTTPPETVTSPPEPTQQPEQDTTSKTAIVIVETARVRKTASTKSDIVDVLDEDDIVTIVAEEGNFYKIKTDKLEGYVSKSLLTVKNVTSRSMTEERINDSQPQETDQTAVVQMNSSASQNDIVAFAKQFLGYPYVLGSSTPEKGFDCSGFTRYVYGHFGFTLGTVAASQTSLGAIVERANLQTGDLILFYNEGKTKIGHCGIFISGGDFIHSANPQRGVVIDNLNTNSYYSERFVTARRIAGG